MKFLTSTLALQCKAGHGRDDDDILEEVVVGFRPSGATP